MKYIVQSSVHRTTDWNRFNMNLFQVPSLYATLVWLNLILAIIDAEPLTNRAAVERKFLKQRVKLARKLYPVGGKQ